MERIQVYTDGGANPNPGDRGLGVVIKKGDKVVREISKPGGKGTNNEAEYQAFIIGVEEVIEMGFTRVEFYTDSRLLVGHMTKGWKINAHNLFPLVQHGKELIDQLTEFSLTWIPRSENTHADRLAGEGMLKKNL